ncbi:MAG: patatin-like phospholipase family protein [Candidatus Aminicenantes bacterium]|nr:patatin-like phospholipase family protein [Candidatus Aminicenantes bacterium]
MKDRRPKIGLALGAGGARGLAHIGVLKAFEKYQIPVDIVTGTSMGALIGGAFASGIDARAMEEIALKADRKLVAKLFFPTISSSGLVDGEKIRNFLEKNIGNKNIESFERKYACVATDILTGEEIVIDRGSVVEAIRASISIPTIFTPVVLENRILVDGGIVNPVPVDLARRMGADIVIAVNVVPLNSSLSGGKKKKSYLVYDRIKISFPNNLVDKVESFFAFSKNNQLFKKEGEEKLFIPNFFNMTVYTLNIFERQVIKLRLEKDRPDFLLEPDTTKVTMMEFYKGKEAIQAGEAAALRLAPKIKNLLGEARDVSKINDLEESS